VVGVVLAPVVAAIGAVTALMTDCTIEVEREQEKRAEAESAGPAQTTH
jgi:hypothetical protein